MSRHWWHASASAPRPMDPAPVLDFPWRFGSRKDSFMKMLFDAGDLHICERFCFDIEYWIYVEGCISFASHSVSFSI